MFSIQLSDCSSLGSLRKGPWLRARSNANTPRTHQGPVSAHGNRVCAPGHFQQTYLPFSEAGLGRDQPEPIRTRGEHDPVVLLPFADQSDEFAAPKPGRTHPLPIFAKTKGPQISLRLDQTGPPGSQTCRRDRGHPRDIQNYCCRCKNREQEGKL